MNECDVNKLQKLLCENATLKTKHFFYLKLYLCSLSVSASWKTFFLFKISKLINIMIHSVNFTLKEQTFPAQSTKRRLYFETLNIVFVSLFPVIIFKAVQVCYEKF